jgi:hypothetical protein
MTDKYFVQWVTQKIVTPEYYLDLRIVGYCVREKHKCGFIAEVDTKEEADAIARLLNSQADIDERA